MERETGEAQRAFQKKRLFESGVAYSIAAVLPVLVSLFIELIVLASGANTESDAVRYVSYLAPQLCLAAVAGIYFFRTKEPIRMTYRGCKWYWFPVAIALEFGLLFSLSEVNGYFIAFLEYLGYHRSASLLPNLAGWNLLPAILVIALLPALFEETLFRGILSRNMKESGWGLWAAALVSGAMFSLFHGSPEQTLYQFVCGIFFTLVALRSGSVFPTMVAHFLNNAVILILTSFYGEGGDIDLIAMTGQGGYIALVVVAALCLVGSVLFLCLFRVRGEKKLGVVHAKTFFVASAAGLVVCAVEWIVVLVSGFLASGGGA